MIKKSEASFLENRKADWENLKYLFKHKKDVYVAGREYGAPRLQLLAHDHSKFSPTLWSPYRDFWFGPEGVKGSNSKEVANRFRSAADLHYTKEQHHMHKGPEGVHMSEVPINTRREMVADWYAVNKHSTGHTETPLEWAKKNGKLHLIQENNRSFYRDKMRDDPTINR